MRRLVVVIILLVLVGVVTAGMLVGGRSGAATGTATTSARPTCSKLSGDIVSVHPTISVTGCTGGLGTGDLAFSTTIGSDLKGKVTWYKQGGKSAVRQGTTSLDKGRWATLPNRCTNPGTELEITGTVSADTTHKIAVGSNVSAYVCLTNVKLTLLKGTVIKL